MGPAIRYAVAALTLVLVCGLLMMELTESDQVVQESAPAPKKSTPPAKITMDGQSWEARELKSTGAHQILSKADAKEKKAREESQTKMLNAQKQALTKQHNINQEARKSMRDAATKSAENQLGTAISAMTKRVKAMAERAAARAAKAISANTRFNKDNLAAERKMKLLEKDVVLLTSAKKKVVLEAVLAKRKYTEKAKKYRAAVRIKVARAEADLKTIRLKLAGYAVAQNTEKLTAVQMHKGAQNVIKLSERLKSQQARVAKLSARQARILRREARENARASKALMSLIQDYKTKLQKLKSRLYKLRHSPDISASMRAKIAAAKAKIRTQESSIQEGDANIRKLKRSLERAMKNTKVLSHAAAKREQVLQTANTAYSNVNAAVIRLRKMAAERAKSIVIKAPKGSLKRSAEKVQAAVNTAIRRVAEKKKVTFRAAIVKAAKEAAAEAAGAMDAKKIAAESKSEVKADAFSEGDMDEMEDAMRVD